MGRDQLDALLDAAFEAHSQGRLDAARAMFQSALAADPSDFDALHMLGVIALQKRDLPAAIGLLTRATEADPEAGMAWTNLGLACLQSGRPDEALPHLEKGWELEPSAEASFGLGVALQAMQRWEDAAASFARTVQAAPRHVEAHVNQGTALVALSRFEEALACFNRALSIQPRHATASVQGGLACLELGRHEEALLAFRQALSLEPTRLNAWLGCADAARALGRHEEAVAAYDKALAIRSDQPAVLSSKGLSLQQLDRPSQALEAFERAWLLAPRDPAAGVNLSAALRVACQFERGLRVTEEVLLEHPDVVEAHANRAHLLMDLGRLDEAIATYEAALRLRPDDVELSWALAWASLLAGDWERGLRLFEVRWLRQAASSRPRGFAQPLWLGEGSLQGKTILLHAEQGLGDTLQFCRYVPLVRALGARVVLEVQAAAVELLRDAWPDEVVVLARDAGSLPAFDCHCPLMSLPLAFNTRPDNVPSSGAYLRADPMRLRASEVGVAREEGRLRVGLVWSGNAAHRNDRNRSIPLADLLAAIPEGVSCLSLQKDPRAADAAVLAQRGDIACLPDAMDTLADTAALMSQVDIVLTVDTAMAHLAGALGKPCWILLPFSPDWRWLLDRPDSPWYPNARLFRQAEPGRWDDALRAVRDALIQEAA